MWVITGTASDGRCLTITVCHRRAGNTAVGTGKTNDGISDNIELLKRITAACVFNSGAYGANETADEYADDDQNDGELD